ncbi:MAG TPA: DNA cytosine methyltransferase [Allosphingosinicella sp.]|nr:DNA cytosine methyltransferase [Allosphingosinicella sp.]
MAEPLRVLSLFAGIGGFDLGLERAGGFKTVAFCEIDPFCRRVLAKHWPEVPCYDDVRTLTADCLAADGIAVDVICGGFPCQDISFAGTGAGLAGERSGLWFEYARLIGELRPSYVLVENVAALLARGLDVVLGTLAALGYDAEWHCIPASAVGAPHRRDRLWIVAHPNGRGRGADVAGRNYADRHDTGRAEADSLPGALCNPSGSRDLAYSAGERFREGGQCGSHEQAQWAGGRGAPVAHAYRSDAQWLVGRRDGPIVRKEQIERQARLCGGAGEHHDWSVEPAVGRVAHGIPHRVGQLRAYGNAVVPQIPELIGRAILEAMGAA